MAHKLFEMLEKGPVVFDGAMGTLLYSRGIFINRNFDELNVSRPDMVEKAHADYLSAGAMVLTTNTFGANGIRLAGHGLAERAAEINRCGVEIARRIAAGKALVAGSIGPSGLIPDLHDAAQTRRMTDAFAAQADALVDAGADLLVLETIRYPAEMEIIMQAIRGRVDVPIIAMGMFKGDSGEVTTCDGVSPAEMAARMTDLGADVIGANCGVGPAGLFDVAEAMLGHGVPVIVQPNAGLPRVIEGRVMYMTTPEYFGEYAKRYISRGVQMFGGCCGTTPEHVRQIAAEIRMVRGGRIEIAAEPVGGQACVYSNIQAPPVASRSAFGRAVVEEFVVSVELDPPTGLDVSHALEGARMLKAAGVRFVNIADGPRATVRMSALAMAAALQHTGLEPVLHVTCRDRNLLGLQADLLGAWSMGLKNLLVITGDPSKLGDYPEATTVYDLDSIGLLRLVSNLNRGIEPSGRRMEQGTAFVKGCGAEPGAVDLDREVGRLARKVESGADYVMTQPVFDHEVMDRFLDRVRAEVGASVPVIMGILPLASWRNAEFLHNEVPGMQIPEPIRNRVRLAGAGEPARAEGVRIACEAAAAFRGRIRGIYIMPPFNRFDIAVAVLEGLGLAGAEAPGGDDNPGS